jgi:hypothetical protein
METTKSLFASVCPPDYKVQKLPIRGILTIGGYPVIRYRLLSLPTLNERSVWTCRIVTRIDHDGASKDLEESVEFDGAFSIRHSNFLGVVDVWRLSL